MGDCHWQHHDSTASTWIFNATAFSYNIFCQLLLYNIAAAADDDDGGDATDAVSLLTLMFCVDLPRLMK